jgi:predicted 3-demethylubiquinone-9 3-methyltransferase (glyoxalase superfamily)
MQKIVPFLWFDNNGEEALNLYTSLFPDARIGTIQRYGKGAPMPEGTMFTATFYLAGQEFMAINGGPMFHFTEAVSLFVKCADQAEIDHYWNKFLESGGQEQMCGWLKDKYGLSWQIIPENLGDLLYSTDPQASQRAMQAMLQMKRLDIAALVAAAKG